LTKGLIHGAIIQSGGGYNSFDKGIPLDTAELTGEALMRFYGCKSIEEMRAIPADSLGNFENRTQDFMKAEHRMGNLSHNLDGYFLNESFSMAADSGNLADIPYMIGGTMEDMRGNSKPIADFSLLREKNGGKVYAYQFARPLPGDDAGAFHSSELWFIFHTLKRCWRPFTAGDEALSQYMVDCWTNFAKYGDPNGNGEVAWKPYTMESPEFMLFTTDGNVNTSSLGQPLAPSVKQ
jgi:para-nitrobenzyl esterase